MAEAHAPGRPRTWRSRTSSRARRRASPGAANTASSTATGARAGCSTAGRAGASRAATSSPRASSPTSRAPRRRRTAWPRRSRPRRRAYAELEDARLAAERASNTDPLTGLANRRSFQRSLEQAVAHCGGRAVRPDPARRRPLQAHQRHATGTRPATTCSSPSSSACARSCPPDARRSRAGAARSSRCSCPACARTTPCARSPRASAQAVRERAPRDAARRRSRSRSRAAASSRAAGATSTSSCTPPTRAMYRAKQTGRDRTLLAGDAVVGGARGQARAAACCAQSFARTASIREGVPEVHCAEVAELAGQIASRLGLPAATVLRCRLAGWLHDVGKITIPRPGARQAGPADRRGMARDGRRTRPSGPTSWRAPPASRESASAVRHHHERWDGAGYPDRLAGDAIPLEARSRRRRRHLERHDARPRLPPRPRASMREPVAELLRRHRRLTARPEHRGGAARDRPRRATPTHTARGAARPSETSSEQTRSATMRASLATDAVVVGRARERRRPAGTANVCVVT